MSANVSQAKVIIAQARNRIAQAKNRSTQSVILVPRLVECARCGETHYRISFCRLERTCLNFTHWAACPKNGEPILLRMEVCKVH